MFDKEFEEKERKEAKFDVKMCVECSYFCTECGRCQDEYADLESEARHNYQREAFAW